MSTTTDQLASLYRLAAATLRELETDRGILASGRDELYGCIFGRDSLITALQMLRVYERTKHPQLARLIRKILLNLAALQGTEHNIESGEQPGKCIHEFRPDNHERLTALAAQPWYVYPDGSMRNYDSLDSTPLFLIAVSRYVEQSGDQSLLRDILPQVNAALTWIIESGDSNHDGFLDYDMHPERRSGGLRVQNWMDSQESLFHEDGTAVAYPVAPIEVQAYAYAALRLWARQGVTQYSVQELNRQARQLKERFNKVYVYRDGQTWGFASGIDGAGHLLTSVRSSMGHCLWAAVTLTEKPGWDSVVYKKFVPALIRRLMAPDLYEPNAGIRTLSRYSSRYQANSYHNGSIWPHDTGMIADGMERCGFDAAARLVRTSLLTSYAYFQTPLELFVFENDTHRSYQENGQESCRLQAWSAATLLYHAADELLLRHQQSGELLPDHYQPDAVLNSVWM